IGGHGLNDDAVVVGQSPFPGPVCANEIALDQVGACSRARDQETRGGVAGNQIAGGRGGAADGVVAGAALDIDAVHVGEGGGARSIGAQEIGLNDVVVGAGDEDAVTRVAGNKIASAGRAAPNRIAGSARLNGDLGGIG